METFSLNSGWQTFISSLTWPSFIAGSIAGASGVAIGHPFDSLKVRLQVGSNAAVQQVNLTSLKALYKGLLPPLISVGAFAALNFALYESCKVVLKTYDNGAKEDLPGTKLSHIFLSGCFSGAIMSTVISPVGAVKLQLQLTQETKVWSCIQHMYQRNGLRSFYRGFGFVAMMDSPGRGVYLWTYESVKSLLVNSSSGRHWPSRTIDSTANISFQNRMTAAVCAGVFSWFVIYPFDVIKARLQLDLEGKRYRNALICIQDIWRQNGFLGFYRGLGYTLIRAGPVAATILPIYDLTKAALDRIDI